MDRVLRIFFSFQIRAPENVQNHGLGKDVVKGIVESCHVGTCLWGVIQKKEQSKNDV